MLLTTYQYCATAGTFVALPAMPKEVPLQVSCAKQALAAINQGTATSYSHDPHIQGFDRSDKALHDLAAAHLRVLMVSMQIGVEGSNVVSNCAAKLSAHLPHAVPVKSMTAALCIWCGSMRMARLAGASPGLCAR